MMFQTETDRNIPFHVKVTLYIWPSPSGNVAYLRSTIKTHSYRNMLWDFRFGMSLVIKNYLPEEDDS